MHIIDRYAYTNQLRNVEPAHKIGLALIVVLLCLGLSKPLVGLVAVGWMFILVVGLAGLSGQTFGRVLFFEATFLVLATIGVLLSVSLSDPRPISRWAYQLGPLWVSTSPEALYQATELIFRALGATAAMNFLALTTPLVDIIDLLRRWRVPAVLVDLIMIMYRYIFVLLDTLNRTTISQESRLGYHTSYWRAMQSAALLGSGLFISAYRRSHRLQTALEARGYEGELTVLPADYQTDWRLLGVGLAIISTMMGAWWITE